MGWFEMSWVGLKSHGLVWNLTGWFEISRVGLKPHEVCLKPHGVLLNHMGSSEISQVLYIIKKLGIAGAARNLHQPSVNLVVKSPSLS